MSLAVVVTATATPSIRPVRIRCSTTTTQRQGKVWPGAPLHRVAQVWETNKIILFVIFIYFPISQSLHFPNAPARLHHFLWICFIVSYVAEWLVLGDLARTIDLLLFVCCCCCYCYWWCRLAFLLFFFSTKIWLSSGNYYSLAFRTSFLLYRERLVDREWANDGRVAV